MFGTVERVQPTFGPVRRGNIPAAIARELRLQIEQGRLEPGVGFPGHPELAALFSVSVGSVREALSMPLSAGLIEAARAGTYFAVEVAVRPPTLPVELEQDMELAAETPVRRFDDLRSGVDAHRQLVDAIAAPAGPDASRPGG